MRRIYALSALSKFNVILRPVWQFFSEISEWERKVNKPASKQATFFYIIGIKLDICTFNKNPQRPEFFETWVLGRG